MSVKKDYPSEVNRYDVFEVSLEGPMEGNPFKEQRIQGIFTSKNESVVTEGFYDGNGIYKIRFMPSFIGRYSFILKSSFLDYTLSGGFIVKEADIHNHGPLRVLGTSFQFEDGTSFQPISTTCYAYTSQFDGDIYATNETLKDSLFNHLCFAIMPLHNENNLVDPQDFPYEGNGMSPQVLTKENAKEYQKNPQGNHFDYARFNPTYFQRLESCIKDLEKMGIVAELILFHPFDRWGFAQMKEDENRLYISYIMNRLSSFHNITWCISDHREQMRFSESEWYGITEQVIRKDPYHHLRTMQSTTGCEATFSNIHYLSLTPDISKPLSFKPLLDMIQKPIIYHWLGSEGNVPMTGYCESLQSLVRRYWTVMMAGTYPSYHESYSNQGNWNENGGTIVGQSSQQLFYLKQIVDGFDGGLEPMETSFGYCSCAKREKNQEKTKLLYYFREMQPAIYTFDFSEKEYVVECIDTIAMESHILCICKGTKEVTLPQKSDLAFLVRYKSENDIVPETVVEDVVEETQQLEEVKEEPHQSIEETMQILAQTVELPVVTPKEEVKEDPVVEDNSAKEEVQELILDEPIEEEQEDDLPFQIEEEKPIVAEKVVEEPIVEDEDDELPEIITEGKVVDAISTTNTLEVPIIGRHTK